MRVELPAAFLSQCQTDQTTTIFGHEIDRFRRDEFGGKHEIALVFPVFLVNENDHAACAQLGNDFQRS